MSTEPTIPVEQADDALAAEYVLGVLDGAQREQVAQRVRQDKVFAILVERWEIRLSDLGDDFAPVAPSAQLKRALDARLFEIGTQAESTSLWASLGFWRLLTGGAVAALLAVVLWTGPQSEPIVQGETLVASLSGADSDARFVALYDTAEHMVRINHIAGKKPTARDYELWLIAGERAPISLGLVMADGNSALSVDPALYDLLAAGTTLAVSLEPTGGSTTGAPSGPVIAVGAVTSI